MDYYAPPIAYYSYDTGRSTAPFRPKTSENAFTAVLDQRHIRSVDPNEVSAVSDRGGAGRPVEDLVTGGSRLSQETAEITTLPEHTDAAADEVAKTRMRLLAAKYVNTTPSELLKEISARLQILDQRLLQRSPTVDQSQLEALDESMSKFEKILQARDARRRALAL